MRFQIPVCPDGIHEVQGRGVPTRPEAFAFRVLGFGVRVSELGFGGSGVSISELGVRGLASLNRPIRLKPTPAETLSHAATVAK
jgi:hypothetical protein